MSLGNYWQAFEPSPDIGLAEYSMRKVFNEQSRPFDFLAFPHMVAPGGPMDSFDAMWIREIVMQWASRLGKTFIVLCGSLYYADLAPCNQILAGNSEDLGLQQTERVRQMGMQISTLAEQGLEKTLKKRLRFGGNTIYAAWARSPVTLSNINALYGGASELDLWEWPNTSKHPDPEEMFGDRFKDNDSSRKVIFESIPTLKGTYEDRNEQERPRSRIEAKRLKGSDCKLWVGCPMCGAYQVLTIDRVSEEGYQCEHCEENIPDEYRKVFIRSGVWVPRGCTVKPEAAKHAASERLQLLELAVELPEGDSELQEVRRQLKWNGWKDCEYIEGTPENDGENASYQLSSIYALSLTWGRIAREESPSQNFVNQWLGETFEVIEDEEYDLEGEATRLAKQITGELERRELPEWTSYIVLTSDRQSRTFPWQLTAWDEDIERVQILDEGEVLALAELEQLLTIKFGDRPLSITGIDAGYLSHDTYRWCLQMTKQFPFKVYPVMGDKAATVKHHYKLFPIEDEKGKKSTYRRIKRVHVNTQSTQEWCNELLATGELIRIFKPEDGTHQDLCEQLLNEQETVRQASRTWDRINTNKPNDQRDDLRYAFVMAQYAKSLRKKSSKTMTMDKVGRASSTPRSKALTMVGPSERPSLRTS